MLAFNPAFKGKNDALTKEPIYVVKIAFNEAATDCYWLTTSSDADLPASATQVLHGVVSKISGTHQGIDPIRAHATIGNISANVIDIAGAFSNVLATKYSTGKTTRGKECQFYVGYRGLAWSEYEVIETQVMSEPLSQDKGLWTIACADRQRSLREKIFDLQKTNLRLAIDDTQLLIPVYSVDAFELVPHGSSYTDAPNTDVLYIKLKDEIIRCTGSTTDGTLGLCFVADKRGALNTKAVEHKVDETLAADRRPEIEEYVYLEMPTVKLIYALLTGGLYNQPGKSLPSRWHRNISTAYVSTAHFVGIGKDWWDPADDTVGVISRIEGVGDEDAKKFIEERLRYLGGFMPVLRDGQLGLKRMANISPKASYVAVLDNSNVVKYGKCTLDYKEVHNQFLIHWNYDPVKDEFTRHNYVYDPVSAHPDKWGASTEMEIEWRDLYGGRHTEEHLQQRFDALRDRYTAPPMIMQVECLHRMNHLEVGDVVRVTLPHIRDPFTGSTLDRSFEIQKVAIDWMTGRVVFDLFGSTEDATPISGGSASTVMDDAWYESEGTNLAAEPGITTNLVGGVLHITGATTGLQGGTSIHDAGSIWYSTTPVELDAGVNLPISGNVQLRIRGNFHRNGTINGKGQGITGAVHSTVQYYGVAGTIGYLGVTQGGGGIYIGRGWSHSMAVAAPVAEGLSNVPRLELAGGSTLTGIPDDLRGTSGGAGCNSVWNTNKGNIVVGYGGDGGASGSGLLVVARGITKGVSSSIDLSGDDGLPGTCDENPSIRAIFGGSGSGGSPGAFLAVTDGQTLATPDLTDVVSAYGKTPFEHILLFMPDPNSLPYRENNYSYTHSYYKGLPVDPIVMGDKSARALFIPADTTPNPDQPEEAEKPIGIVITEFVNVPPTPAQNLTSMEVAVTPPSDTNYDYAMVYYRVQGQTAWTLAGPADNERVIERPADGTTYDIQARPVSISGVESEDGFTTQFTVANQKGGVVLESGNYMDTAPNVGQPTNGQGMRLSINGLEGFDAAGSLNYFFTEFGAHIGGSDVDFTVGSAVDYSTGNGIWYGMSGGRAGFRVGDPANKKYLGYSPVTNNIEVGRDTELQGVDAYNNESINHHGFFGDQLIIPRTVGTGSVVTTGGVKTTLKAPALNDVAALDDDLSSEPALGTSKKYTWFRGRDIKSRFKYGRKGTSFEAFLRTGGNTLGGTYSYGFGAYIDASGNAYGYIMRGGVRTLTTSYVLIPDGALAEIEVIYTVDYDGVSIYTGTVNVVVSISTDNGATWTATTLGPLDFTPVTGEYDAGARFVLEMIGLGGTSGPGDFISGRDYWFRQDAYALPFGTIY